MSQRIRKRRHLAPAFAIIDELSTIPPGTWELIRAEERRETTRKLVDGTISIGGVEVARFDEVEFT